MLFVVIGQIASGSDFSAITRPDLPADGDDRAAFHAGVMVLYAKLTRTELFSLAAPRPRTSAASPPRLWSAFNKQLVPVGAAR